MIFFARPNALVQNPRAFVFFSLFFFFLLPLVKDDDDDDDDEHGFQPTSAVVREGDRTTREMAVTAHVVVRHRADGGDVGAADDRNGGCEPHTHTHTHTHTQWNPSSFSLTGHPGSNNFISAPTWIEAAAATCVVA